MFPDANGLAVESDYNPKNGRLMVRIPGSSKWQDLYTQKRGAAGERHLIPSLTKTLTKALGISTQSIIDEKEGESRDLRKELQEKTNQFAESCAAFQKR